jgi:hypothetical protein
MGLVMCFNLDGSRKPALGPHAVRGLLALGVCLLAAPSAQAGSPPKRDTIDNTVLCVAGCPPDMHKPVLVYRFDKPTPTYPLPGAGTITVYERLSGVYCGQAGGCRVAGIIPPPDWEPDRAALAPFIIVIP